MTTNTRIFTAKFFIGTCLSILHVHAHAQAGLYENLLIGINPENGVLTGAFSEQRGISPGPTFSCIFAIKGTIRTSAIRVGFPDDKEVSQGTLTLSTKDNKTSMHLKLGEAQPGCAQASPLDFTSGVQLEQSATKAWRAVFIVTAKRTHFYDAPNGKAKRKAYLVYADCVGVLELRGAWAKVEYASYGKSTFGWLPLSDLGTL